MSGAGFGMLAMIGLGIEFDDSVLSIFMISAVAVGLAVAGLLSSTFHLGHPERAWRALTQWRSSWLSREGVAAILALIVYGIYALWWMVLGDRITWLGYLTTFLSVVTVFTTSMIYAQLKTVPMWNRWLTPVTYLAFAGATGFLLASGLGRLTTEQITQYAISGFLWVLLAWAAKVAWWRCGSTSLSDRGSTAESATGLGFIGKVKLLERPHTGPNYLTKEMVHVIGRKHARKLRLIAMLVGGLLPMVFCGLVIVNILPQIFLFVAGVTFILGLFAERWLFFAEARHAVSLYY